MLSQNEKLIGASGLTPGLRVISAAAGPDKAIHTQYVVNTAPVVAAMITCTPVLTV